MIAQGHRIAFGPIPSRRLGRSLGVNNIPAKACSYSCVYCQVGPTRQPTTEPAEFLAPRAICDEVTRHLEQIRASGDDAEFLTFVPDGEPTLDVHLGEAIAGLRTLGVPIAVITNASLLWRAEVRDRLNAADLVSVKVDSVQPEVWGRINRPHPNLSLEVILAGISAFAAQFEGTLISETMIVAGINDGADCLQATAAHLRRIGPERAYLAVPVRPPAVEGTRGPDEAGLVAAHQVFSAALPVVELLTGHEVGAFGHTGDAREDLLAITAVHPMREQSVRDLLARDGSGWELVEALLAGGELRAVEHSGTRFLVRAARSRGDT